MNRIVEASSVKPRLARRHQGLLKLSPDLISKARGETATQVTRIGLTFLGTAAFCLLSLLSPDSALLGGSEKINVPFAGPVSFFGFMLLGPAVLIVLRVYLQIYVEHSDRLDRLTRSVSAMRAPTLVPLQNSLIRVFSGLTFYLLLPVTMMLFAWKAAVFPAWGSGLLCVATGVVVGHVMLPFSRFSWQSKAFLSISAAMIGAAIIAGGVVLGFGPPRRPFDLFRVNLSGSQSLAGVDLHKAYLRLADLRGANLSLADLRDANLRDANLSNTNLTEVNLRGADLTGANLRGANSQGGDVRDRSPRVYLSYADLGEANLSGADLPGADLSNAFLKGATLNRANLSVANLSGANLREADLDRVTLYGADLSEANLREANLSGADLSGAYLRGANLITASLRNADLRKANLSQTILLYADLSDADLSDATNLTQMQLDEACGGSANTKLPEGLTIKPCP